MHLFKLPGEVLVLIIEEFANSVELKRLMRRRLVSRQFKAMIDKTIFRLKLLDDSPNVGDFASRKPYFNFPEAREFALDYLVYQSSVETEPSSVVGRIRRAATVLAERDGEMTEDRFTRRFKSLCLLSLQNSRNVSGHADIRFLFSPARAEPTGCSTGALTADGYLAAIWMDDISTIQGLVDQQICFYDFEYLEGIKSNVFGLPLFAACLKGRIPMIRLLLSSNPLRMMSPYYTPHNTQFDIIRIATESGHKDVFNFAIDTGPPIQSPRLRHRPEAARGPGFRALGLAIFETPVIGNYNRAVAVVYGSDDLVDLTRALARSAEAGQKEKVEYLLGKGAALNYGKGGKTELMPSRDNIKYKPLLGAVKSNDPDIVMLLLSRGADPNWFSPVDTALMAAARVSSTSIARMLLEAGADVNEGCPPPIAIAVFKEDVRMFNLLLEHGARLDTPETGNWAMGVARHHQLDCMIRLLEQQGVERDAVLQRCAGRGENYTLLSMFRIGGGS